MKSFLSKCLIDGEWRSARSGATFVVRNPATDEVLAEVPSLEVRDVEEAIESAAHAFTMWAAIPARTRAQILYNLERLLLENAPELASIITAEQGKPLREARGEVEYAAHYVRWFAEEATRVYGDIVPADSRLKRIFVTKQPIGVVAAITPWNFPVAMLARKLAAALAAGCTVINKPAPETPLSAIFLGSLCKEAGTPAGVVSILTGDAETIGPILMRSELVRKVSFTGSTEVGKLLIQQSAHTVKKLTLELGGNAPCIVLEDADLERAVDGAIFGKYRNAGQTCICINRFLVHSSVADAFTDKLVARSSTLRVGDGTQETTDIGPLISHEAVEKVTSLVTSALAEGAHAALQRQECSGSSRFMCPIVLTRVTPTMRISREEVFGPVSTISTFSNDAEAISVANASEFGLAAYIYSKDTGRALQIAEQLQFGMVGINDTAISAVQAPFGGIKQSGFGREGSKYGIDEYLTLKYTALHL